MDSKIIISILILLFVILFGSFTNYELFVPRSILYDRLYKRNKDLDYVSKYLNIHIDPLDNIRSQQISPIMGKQNDMTCNTLWGSAKVSKDYHKRSNRIPDKYSTKYEYNHPIVGNI